MHYLLGFIHQEISEAEEIPMPFLWKILQSLARKKLIRSFKGIRGGYELARPADRITLKEIVATTDGTDIIERCVLGLPECSEDKSCPLHQHWKEIKTMLQEMLEENTLATLAKTR